MNNGKKMRDVVKKNGIAILPGTYDGMSAKVVEYCGFEAAYVTGCGMHAGQLGAPDVDLLTLTEMADQMRRICNSISIPIMADAQEGFGGVQNVIRTIRLYEEAGVAAIQLDDEVTPSQCPFHEETDGERARQELIPVDEMCEKIKAACEARESKDTIIVVRSDTRGSVYDTVGEEHIHEQIKRLNAYVKAGAECIFPIAISYENYKKVLTSVDAPYKMCCISPQLDDLPGYDLHKHTAEEYKKDMGCNIMIMPVLTATAGMKAMIEALEYYKANGIQDTEKYVMLSKFNEVLHTNLRYR